MRSLPLLLLLLLPHPSSKQVQEAMLTGESVPISKNTTAVPAESGLGDRKCLAYSATAVSAGQGLGVVIATGEAVAAAAAVGYYRTLFQAFECSLCGSWPGVLQLGGWRAFWGTAGCNTMHCTLWSAKAMWVCPAGQHRHTAS
jgi:hypothetical protein